jgi:hypothetical protein
VEDSTTGPTGGTAVVEMSIEIPTLEVMTFGGGPEF